MSKKAAVKTLIIGLIIFSTLALARGMDNLRAGWELTASFIADYDLPRFSDFFK